MKKKVRKNQLTERKLIVSVILRAVKDYLDGNNPHKIDRLRSKGQDHELSQLEKNFRSAKFWIFDEKDTDYIFSFEKCCEIISVSPQRIRRGLDQLIQTNDHASAKRNIHQPVT